MMNNDVMNNDVMNNDILNNGNTNMMNNGHTNIINNEFCCVMTPGFSKDIQCHIRPYTFLFLQITRSDIGLHVILSAWWLEMAVCVGMYGWTYFITPEVR